ncbi:MAG TPA: hypothetical protein VHD36_24180 [Pirellulales bacterium]|nr:hypothetical protein [Pirellulales bacterium]
MTYDIRSADAAVILTQLTRGLIVAALIGFAGCGPYPPSVAKKAEIDALPASTRSVYARSLSDGDVPALARLRELTLLDFTPGYARKDLTTGFKKWEAAITDEGLAKLAAIELPKLETLGLGHCEHITDAGLVHVAKMDSVTSLHLEDDPGISDVGLQHLLAMKNLTALDLRGCQGITDAGLQILAGKPGWQMIALGRCSNITAQGIAKLRAALPNAKIDLRAE